MQNRGDNVLMNTYGHFPITIEKGEGIYLYDNKGKKYLDFVAGIAVNALGTGNEKLVKAISDQAAKLIHCSNLYYNEPQVKLAEMLTEKTDFDKVFFCNSGAEAVECMLKLCRKYAYKKHKTDCAEGSCGCCAGGMMPTEIIAMENSFHGRTYGSLTVTGQPKYHKGFRPMLPDVNYVPYNDFDALASAVSDKTCAVLMEVIQGEGGLIPADKEYLQKVRKLCDEKGILLVFDEIQSGIGRSGELYAHQAMGVTPDIITSAKGLAGGVPIGAVLAKDFVASAYENGDHGSTFGGNPLACSAALAVLGEIYDNDLLSHVKEAGAYLTEKLNEIAGKYKTSDGKPIIKAVRGMGLMQGIELDESVVPKDIIGKCIEGGLLLVGAGASVIRFVPPLIVTKEQIDDAMSILENALK